MVFNICWGTPYDPQSSLAAMRAPVYGDYAAQLGLEDKADIDQATRIFLYPPMRQNARNFTHLS